MDESDLAWIAKITGATRVKQSERIQSLWGGYGEILRVSLTSSSIATAIVKSVTPPRANASKTADSSHARKCRSYDVEMAFYREFASRCDDTCRVARLIDSKVENGKWLFVLEDLDEAGYPRRSRNLDTQDIDACLAWLASFHARFLRTKPNGLWKTGTYWHLATRSDELAAMHPDDDDLRQAAPLLDKRLREATFQTLVHGDAKPANFCFARRSGEPVAAVDFQYVGGGCGMKDVAYLLSDPNGSDGLEAQQLTTYFRHLLSALSMDNTIDRDALESEWRALYPLACADYYRFLAGWAKEHWRRDVHAQRIVQRVLRSL